MLIQTLGLRGGKSRQLIDFWRALEYLEELAKSKRLAGPANKLWLTTQKKWLLRCKIGSVVEEPKALVGPLPTESPRI